MRLELWSSRRLQTPLASGAGGTLSGPAEVYPESHLDCLLVKYWNETAGEISDAAS